MTAVPYTLTDLTEVLPGRDEPGPVSPGDLVKMMFDSEAGSEAMWVLVTGARAGGYAGILDNRPMFVPAEPGEVVEFAEANIICVMRARAAS